MIQAGVSCKRGIALAIFDGEILVPYDLGVDTSGQEPGFEYVPRICKVALLQIYKFAG